MSLYSADELDLVFGSESTGTGPRERAATSKSIFVRSQVLLAQPREGASGLTLKASQALSIYGWEILLAVAREGSAVISDTRVEPAKTVSDRRSMLGLTSQQIARAAGITLAQMAKIETPGAISPIRDIANVAAVLALDERVVGFEPAGRGDQDLGVRLREMSQSTDAFHFSSTTVLRLAEAAWVVKRQRELSRALGIQSNSHIENGHLLSANYSYPTYMRGYELAAQARSYFGLGDVEAIPSLRTLLERELGIPLVQEQLSTRFAGATIANGNDRGIVVNEAGHNQNVFVRRMTLAHELGHLVGDPDGRLNKLRVDDYEWIEADSAGNTDPVEMRANGFAIAFLAPINGVRALVGRGGSNAEILSRVTDHYGISRTAATWHIKNATRLDVSGVHPSEIPEASAEWVARENLTLDYFPLGTTTPLSRRGRFAYLVARAFAEGLVSADSAALWLRVTPDAFMEHYQDLLGLFN